MALPEMDRGRPAAPNRTTSRASVPTDTSSVVESADILADLDALAEHLGGRFVVQVVVDADRGHRRTNVYRSCAAAERAVERARARGQAAHVTLVRMLPVGVVVGLGGGR